MSGGTTSSDRGEKMLTFTGGGYVLLLAGLILVALLVWALWGPITRQVSRPPGDGENPDSYGFDLTNLAVSRDLLATPLRHRDLVRSIDAPAFQTVAEIESERKHVVPTDRVVGVEIDGAARAYPLAVLTVHEIVNDTLGGVPIVVTYFYMGDAPMVGRRDAGTTFGSSGLVWNGNTLLYDRAEAGSESLWLQMTGTAVSGPRVGETLAPVPFELVSWERWRTLHPETTVLARLEERGKVYDKATPTQYFNSDEVPFTVEPLAREHPKARVTVVDAGGVRLAYPHLLLESRVDDSGRVRVEHGPVALDLVYDIESRTVAVENVVPADAEVTVRHALWFAWHALHPEDDLAE